MANSAWSSTLRYFANSCMCQDVIRVYLVIELTLSCWRSTSCFMLYVKQVQDAAPMALSKTLICLMAVYL